jgi:gas vesicle protein
MSDNGGSNTNAFLLGIVVGGVLGVLFAPENGEETRKKVKDNWREWSRKALEVAEGLREEGAPRIEEAMETLRPMVDKAASAVGPAVEGARGRIEPYAEQVRETAERSIPVVKQELDEAADRARAELERRSRRSRPRFFSGV